MIDPKKLKGFQKTLDEKGGDDLFVNASKIEGTLDVRILDPLPNMEGMYALEIPVWWVDKTKIISPELWGGVDTIQAVIDEAKGANQPDLNALLAAKNQWGQPKVRKSIEYWIAILPLDWKIENDEIIGIADADGVLDLTLVNKFIRKQHGWILNCKTQLMKAINHEATTRGGHIMFDRVKGFNLILEKTGQNRETTYTASKADFMEMPAQYYGEGNTPDVMNICKAATFTDDYIDAVYAGSYPNVGSGFGKDAKLAVSLTTGVVADALPLLIVLTF